MRTFTVTLKTHDARAYRRLAMTLKTALRRDQLKAIFVSANTHAMCRRTVRVSIILRR